jgi:predicted DNA-binding transcriptional regulator YafY
MSQLERLQKINHLIQERGHVTTQDFLSELEVSLATFKRDLEHLRSTFNAPIIYDRESQGYKFDKPNAGKKFELPGMWFNEQEATALATMQQLLSSLDSAGLIGPHLAPIMTRIDSILGNGQTSSKELRKRIKILSIGIRKSNSKNFEIVGKALLDRKRLNISYFAKSTNQTTQREISPQRLIHYRDNWYLDALCHLKKELRSFSIDGILNAELILTAAQEISNEKLETHFSGSYGIFSGEPNQTAVLKFNPERARWVSKEIWHPNQKGTSGDDGSYILEFKYNQTPELVMDILKYGSDVEVMSPESLRSKVQTELKKALLLYRK